MSDTDGVPSYENPEHRVYKNVLRMLKVRKWNVPKIMTAQEYDMVDSKLLPIYQHKEDGSRVLVVFFSFVDKLRKMHIDKYVNDMSEIGANEGLIVYKNDTTPTARSEVLRHDLELIRYSNMYRCILDHHLMPQYELLSDDDKKKMDERYGLDKIPRMLVTDPVAQYFQAQLGDVFKCVRKNKQTLFEVYYRMVVPNLSKKKK